MSLPSSTQGEEAGTIIAMPPLPRVIMPGRVAGSLVLHYSIMTLHPASRMPHRPWCTPSLPGEYTPGICTIELLNLLGRTHNEILNRFRGEGVAGGPAGGAAAGSVEVQGIPAQGVAAPRVNYLSLSSLVERQLIVYDRQVKCARLGLLGLVGARRYPVTRGSDV